MSRWQTILIVVACCVATFGFGASRVERAAADAAESAVEARDGEILEMLQEIRDTLHGLRMIQTNHVEVSGSEHEARQDSRIREMLIQRGHLKGAD